MSIHVLRALALPLLAGSVFVACTATINADLRGRGEVPANASEISSCKSACSKQAGASCLGDVTACDALCEGATSSGVARYQDCVSANTCDESCPTQLQYADAAAPTVAADAGSPLPSDGGRPVVTTPTTPDSGQPSGRVDAGKTVTGDPCSNACGSKTPDVFDCYNNDPDEESICMGRCFSGSTQTTRQTFVDCVGGLASAAPADLCSLYFMTCYEPFTK